MSQGMHKSMQGDIRVGNSTASVEKPTETTIRGYRWQMLRALRLMAADGHIYLTISKEKGKGGGGKQEKVTGYWVHGGRRLMDAVGAHIIQQGWVGEPERHWIKGMKKARLTPEGMESLKEGEAWWRRMGVLQKMKVMLCE